MAKITVLEFYNFNPRSHAGSDWYHKVTFAAPEDFNPRSHAGSDNRARGWI